MRSASCFMNCKFLGRVVARHGQMVARGAKILADGQHVDADVGEIAVDIEEFVHLLAEADHDSGLGNDVSSRVALENSRRRRVRS